MPAIEQGGALVVFSGGQDSTTCLAWSLDRYDRVLTIGFDYGQRHRIELDCRQAIRREIAGLSSVWKERLGDDFLLELDLFRKIGGSALTEDVALRMNADGLPNTFVPGRNLVFLTAAAAYAYRQGLRNIVLGVCETDFSGYPDCRDDTIKAMQVAVNLGMNAGFVLRTPLMRLDKAATWALARGVGGEALVDLIVEHTHTCYLGEREKRMVWGYGCGSCPACELRRLGWEAYQSSRR